MIETRMIMGMPIIVEVLGLSLTEAIFTPIFDYLDYVDRKFSTYKPDSEISMINRGELTFEEASDDMKAVFLMAEHTRLESDGYFDIRHNGVYDPSGIVKGWAVYNAAELLQQAGFENYSIYAGGDIQVSGKDPLGRDWRVGIQNPFSQHEIVKVLSLPNCGIATSGTYIRGAHIYNPSQLDQPDNSIISLTVIGPNVYEADRFATAAFAMGPAGINFIERMEGLEGYMIDLNGLATYTSGFERYVIHV